MCRHIKQNIRWGPGGRSAPGGSRAKPLSGVQGAEGPRKLLKDTKIDQKIGSYPQVQDQPIYDQ
ncbi:hypothetical protein DPMN_028101 [Dreissena polymorpha]|uniref:Uncharacterized protein n=1 Tax=Dreissena polymorpha TaxID=45954 RepID=A0A9D4RF02_DREPO|nr:hypothetical protein DPMN_028101 [Dreissena polymorpha]